MNDIEVKLIGRRKKSNSFIKSYHDKGNARNSVGEGGRRGEIRINF